MISFPPMPAFYPVSLGGESPARCAPYGPGAAGCCVEGLRQRVAIASIPALKPKAIVVDEPTTGQDVKQSLEIMNFLKELHEQHGHIVIFITHDMPIVARYAKRVIAMGQGEILADGSTAEIFSDPAPLARTFVEPPQITQLAQRVQHLGFDPGTLTVEEMIEQFYRRIRQINFDKSPRKA